MFSITLKFNLQTQTLQNGTQNNITANITSPKELNLSDGGYSGTQVDHVVEYRNCEAQAHLESHKKKLFQPY
jgi:hypothetical protein